MPASPSGNVWKADAFLQRMRFVYECQINTLRLSNYKNTERECAPCFLVVYGELELLGSDPEVLFVKTEEVGVIVKTYCKAGFTNGLLLPHQIVKQVKPPGDEVLIGRNTHIIPK